MVLTDSIPRKKEESVRSVKIREELVQAIESGISALAPELSLKERPIPALESPKKADQGDFSTPVAMVIGSMTGTPPRKVAERLKSLLPANRDIEKVDVAGPGYLNITLKRSFWYQALRRVILEKEKYGSSRSGSGIRVQIEFVSANPTGPLHVGHGRGAVIGDTLANLFEAAGYDVHREYYINDVGRQIERLGESVWARYRQLKGENAQMPEEGYEGEYVTDIARDFLESGSPLPQNDAGIISFFSDYSRRKILEGIREDLTQLRIQFDEWYSEKDLHEKKGVSDALDELRRRGFLYDAEGAVWFATSRFGDDKDRIVVKKNGDTTYYASDIAYHYEKFRRGFDRLINIWGADHHGYIQRVKAAIQALGYSPARLDILLIQLVSLVRNGKPVAMSKRSGEYITLREVVNEVGADATRFFFLSRGTDIAFDFDLELAKRQSNENPVYYVQYAYARLSSVIRNARERGLVPLDETEIDLSLLSLDEELELIKHLASYPDLVQASAESLDPHRLSFYLLELAGKLHPYYFKHRILSENLALTRSRLFLTEGVKTVIENTLKIMGIHAPEQM